MLRLADGKKLPLVQVRRSRVHGNGVFALGAFAKAHESSSTPASV